MNLKLRVWRQKDARDPGRLVDYEAPDVNPEMSFLEMLDVVNERLIGRGEEPIAFDSDCREGICGTCSLVINGIPHGGQKGTTACQLHLRHFKDGDTITIEPWRAKAFPVVKDLRVVNMVKAMDAEGFGNCTVTGSCEAVCPKEISLSFIARMNREYAVAL